MAGQVAAITVHAMVEGLVQLGLDRADLIHALGVELADPPPPAARVGADCLGRLWEAALRQRPDPAMATALGLAIPYGAFGFTDYLAGSSVTVGGGFESLALHLRLVAGGIRLELDVADGLRWVRLLTPDDERPPFIASEMTVALFVGRFRAGTDGAFQPAFACLRCDAPPGGSPQARLLGVPVHHGSPVAALAIPAAMWGLPLRRADPYLHGTLRRSVEDLGLMQSSADALELAIRARLRDALADQGADARSVARLLGMSVRTLQRRLVARGRTWTEVVEAFRRDEATRLLAGPEPIVEIVARLGYREQTSFTRAFRRWTGRTPAQWRRSLLSPRD
ncbi:MAG TPA: AraC family transcriptional regulator ligand-binding domain-containing protein [Rubrivivax sp.]|nr:AraC family transcriptional regulator [Burkholderiales bacterium]HNT38157.1 AraC family transcriptional regulator ligand-binding domain-containing protein [Rubrivivax sp.]